MEDVDYALRMIPHSHRQWILRSLRSGSATASQIATQFTASQQDPAYQPMLRGLTMAKTLSRDVLDGYLKRIDLS